MDLAQFSIEFMVEYLATHLQTMRPCNSMSVDENAKQYLSLWQILLNSLKSDLATCRSQEKSTFVDRKGAVRTVMQWAPDIDRLCQCKPESNGSKDYERFENEFMTLNKLTQAIKDKVEPKRQKTEEIVFI